MTKACLKSSTISDTQEVQNLDNFVPEPNQNLVSSYKDKTKENLNKQAKVIFNERVIALFFKKNNWPEIEALKFYAFIKSKKWKIDDWQMIAKIFAKNNFELKEPKITSPISGYVNNIRQMRDKK